MGSRIRRVSSRLQTALSVDWEDETPATVVEEYMYDPRVPREFYVYPPNDGAGLVRAVYVRLPEALSTLSELSENVSTWGAQELPVEDVYAEAIAHFVLHRAYSKEAEWALDPARAKQHFELYIEAINTKVSQDSAFSDHKEPTV